MIIYKRISYWMKSNWWSYIITLYFLTARNITRDKISFWNLFNLFILIFWYFFIWDVSLIEYFN